MTKCLFTSGPLPPALPLAKSFPAKTEWPPLQVLLFSIIIIRFTCSADDKVIVYIGPSPSRTAIGRAFSHQNIMAAAVGVLVVVVYDQLMTKCLFTSSPLPPALSLAKSFPAKTEWPLLQVFLLLLFSSIIIVHVLSC